MCLAGYAALLAVHSVCVWVVKPLQGLAAELAGCMLLISKCVAPASFLDSILHHWIGARSLW